MNKSLSVAIAFITLTILSANVAAEEGLDTTTIAGAPADDFDQAVSMCPIAVAFGIVSINYEHLFAQTHGLVLRFDYEGMPDYLSDKNLDASGKGLIVNYRWHLSPSMNSIFAGVYGRYRVYDGRFASGTEEADFAVTERTLGLNVGKRWVWDNGLSITFAVGYGLSDVSEESDASSEHASAARVALQEKYDFASPSFGELSAGYAF